MRFFSDNAARAHPAVLAALAAANRVDTAYDGDALSGALDGAFSELFGTPVAALWVASGTAANGLALAALCPPHGAVLCHPQAHIHNDECGAPEFYTHGAKLMPVPGEDAKLIPAAIEAFLGGLRDDVHRTPPAALSITNATETGLVYDPDEIAALAEVARGHGLALHMDGARFANAVAHAGCPPAELTWRAGIDALSFGFVKNGGMSAEALILFDPELAAATRYRRKRAGHLLSKGRFMAAQLLALIEHDRWLDNAAHANICAARLAGAVPERLIHPVEANELFVRLTAEEALVLRDKGFDFYDWGPGAARFVVSWDQPPEEVGALAAALRAL